MPILEVPEILGGSEEHLMKVVTFRTAGLVEGVLGSRAWREDLSRKIDKFQLSGVEDPAE